MRLLGVGKLVITSIMSWLMAYPSEVSMKPAKWALFGMAKFEFVTVQRNFSFFTAAQDLSDMFHMLLFILVKDNYVVDYLPDALYPSKGFIHSPVVVLTNGRYGALRYLNQPKGVMKVVILHLWGIGHVEIWSKGMFE